MQLNITPVYYASADFEPIFARSGSAVTPSENSSINTNRKSTTRFSMSLRWSSYVAPQKGGGAQKRKTAVFGVKSHSALRKSAAKFLCVKTVSDKVVRHTLA